MSELKIGDMAVVIHHPSAEYDEGCGPGTIGTITQQCWCPEALIELMRTGQAVVRFTSAAGSTFCIATLLLRKIEPPANEAGSWDKCVWNPTKETTDA
jgi:hypothetical protein